MLVAHTLYPNGYNAEQLHGAEVSLQRQLTVGYMDTLVAELNGALVGFAFVNWGFSIRKGQPINDGIWMAHSTLLGLMGRMAAYSGKEITWEMALNSQEKLVPDNLTWDMPLPIKPMAMPGTAEFV